MQRTEKMERFLHMISFGQKQNPKAVIITIGLFTLLGWAGWVFQSSLEYGFFPHSYKSVSCGFKVRLPSQWKDVEKKPKSVLFSCYQPPSDYFKTTLQFRRMDEKSALSNLLETVPEQAREEKTEITVCGVDSYRMGFVTDRRLRNMPVHVRNEITVVGEDTPLVITMTAEEADWDEFSEDYESIMESLELLGQQSPR